MRFIDCLVLAAIAGAAQGLEGLARAGVAPGERQQFALLIGVSRYPSLPERYQLEGPANDVRLMRDLLIGRFGFPPAGDRIIVLSEPSAARDPRLLPTRANIIRELTSLADRAGEGDRVVVFLAGHGSQQPQRKIEEAQHQEPDGLDEIFLPRDVGKWTDEGQEVENAILDDELGEWLDAIRAKGARIWLIVDACHSGDIARGVGDRDRMVRADALGVPSSVVAAVRRQAAERAGQTRGGSASPPQSVEMSDMRGMAVLYACQPHERTIERRLPAGGDTTHGLLTYTLNTVLSKATQPISYTELAKRIYLEYGRLNRSSPVPLVEGGDVQRVVLGDERATGQVILVRWSSVRGMLKIDAGRLHGLTENSVLAAYRVTAETKLRGEAALANDALIGHIRIIDLKLSEATVEPCRHADREAPSPSRLDGARCRIVERDHGELRLRVMVDENDAQGDPIPVPVKQQLVDGLSTLAADKTSLIAIVSDAHDAEWFIRWNKGDVFVLPAEEWQTVTLSGDARKDSTFHRAFGPFRCDDRLQTVLRNVLRRVAKAENLLRIARDSAGETVRSAGSFGVTLNITAAQHPRGLALRFPACLCPGDQIQFLVENPSAVPFDLTFLYVDSQCRVSALFPMEGEANRWYPGDLKRLPVIKIDSATLGWEHFIAIAVRAKGQPIDFTALAEGHEDESRTRGRRHPLGRLLENAMHGDGHRGTSRAQVDDYECEMLSLRVWPKGG